MKIGFLTQNLNTADGGGRFSYDLVSGLKNCGIEIKTVATEQINPLFDFLKIRKILKNSDIIHAIDIWPNGFYARLISFGLKKPVIITALGTYSVSPFYSWRKPLAKWACKKTQIIAISDYTKSEVKKIAPDSNVGIITPGLDLNFWISGKVYESEMLKFKPYILSVGALKPRKGYHNSIESFAIVAKKIEPFNYVIVGQGKESNYSKKLKKIIKDSGLKNRTLFISTGIDDRQLLEFYRNAELFILTPVEENHHFEGFGIVYLEAAASGLPVIASKNSGAESAVKNGYNGILVPQNDPKAAADAILKIMESPELKNNFGKKSIEWAKNFDQNKITAEYIKIYYSHAKYH